MKLYGTYLDKYAFTDGDSYVLSNNSGKVLINGSTEIYANDDGTKPVAFDVYNHASYTAPVVTVASSVKVNGTIEAAAKISNVYYATLQDAIDAVVDGGTVTLFRDVEGAGVVINKNLTINFAGFT
jgi:hypothetical protein